MRTTLDLPDGTSSPLDWFAADGGTVGILVLPSIFGADAGTLDHATHLARAGHPTLVPSLFHRTDPGPADFSEQGRARALARMRAYDRDTGLPDLVAAAAWLQAQDGVHAIVAHGICFGGHLAALLAMHGAVDAVHTVHGGGLERVAERGAPPCPVVVHTGTADASIPEEAVRAVERAWPHAEIHRHEGARHGFAHPGSPSYDEAAYEAATASLLRLAASVGA